MRLSIEASARIENKVVLVMDKDMAEFYIDMLGRYAVASNDKGVRDDALDLQNQAEFLWDWVE
jgi:hypothetical protein